MNKLMAILIVSGLVLFGCAQPAAPPKADDAGATPAGIAAVSEANGKFAFSLYSELNKQNGGKNVFFSPYSISTAFAMVYEGARGKTADEIAAVFNFPGDNAVRRSSYAAIHNKLNEPNALYKLNIANALWVQKDYPLLSEYASAVDQYYAGKATNVDFVGATEEARQTINKWVEVKTNDKIKDLFKEGDLDASYRLVLTNAIYFKGVWVRQFDKKETKEEEFRVSKDQRVQVPMMRITDEDAKFNYAENDVLQMLEMPYKGGNLSMLILLPKSDDLDSLEKVLNAENLREWRGKMQRQRVIVYMPKFTFKTDYKLGNNLMAMGMPSAFTDGAADFSGMDGSRRLFIGIVVHKAFVDVNEEGTEAAAATGVGMQTTSVGSSVTFRADHPFIFLIQQSDTGNILFMGKVADPTKSPAA